MELKIQSESNSNKEKAKEQIKILIEKYERLESEGKLKKLNEETTKSWFIEPLLFALGWDIHSENVTKEERVSKGRADYAFRLNGVVKFFLEAKAIKEDLDDQKFAKQTIEYGWHKGITWAVLTDFETIKVFNCEWNEKDNWRNLLFSLSLKQFLTDDRLFLLSYESFKNDDIGKYADSIGKRIPRKKITEHLLLEFIDWRTKLLNDLKKTSSNYTESDRDEMIQTFLDRIIFIRSCEDRGYEEQKLNGVLREYNSHNKDINLLLKDVFRYYDKIYDSKIFELRAIDEVSFNQTIISNILERIYKTNDGNIAYDFSLIDADILGNLYEQYLSYISKKLEEKNLTKRKSQGIYYTPTYIVDYIVKNTLGELLKNKKVDVEKIKILDPACGSGSFLIKSFDFINEYYKKKKNYEQRTIGDDDTTYSVKEKILLNNIFGVDLDRQAVEISQLNLLLKIAKGGYRLPILRKNICEGNSLIDNENIAKLSTFKWEEKFKEIWENGGFDVVLGNPPYVRPENVEKKERDYYLTSNKYDKFFGRFDLYILFIEKALKLLKKDGYFSFIIPYSFLNQNYSKILREWILKEFKIVSIIDLSQVKVFESAEVNTCVLVIQKSKPKKDYNLKILKPINLTNLNNSQIITLKQNIFIATPQFMIRTDLDNKKIEIINKITKDTLTCSEIFYVVIGSVPHDSKTGASKDRLISSTKSADSFKKYIEGKDMSRYKLDWRHIYLNYQPKMMHRPKFPELFENEKLIIRNISTKEGLLSVYDDNNYFTNDTVSLCVPWFKLREINIKGENINQNRIDESKKYNLKFCLGIINSKVLNFYFKHILSSNLHVYPEAIRNLPIKITSESQQQLVGNLADKMLFLNKRLNEIGDKKTDERLKIEEEIKRVDSEIDELVYNIYEITEEEKKIIEESLK